jgi:hypothetical protein
MKRKLRGPADLKGRITRLEAALAAANHHRSLLFRELLQAQRRLEARERPDYPSRSRD